MSNGLNWTSFKQEAGSLCLEKRGISLRRNRDEVTLDVTRGTARDYGVTCSTIKAHICQLTHFHAFRLMGNFDQTCLGTLFCCLWSWGFSWILPTVFCLLTFLVWDQWPLFCCVVIHIHLITWLQHFFSQDLAAKWLLTPPQCLWKALQLIKTRQQDSRLLFFPWRFIAAHSLRPHAFSSEWPVRTHPVVSPARAVCFQYVLSYRQDSGWFFFFLWRCCAYKKGSQSVSPAFVVIASFEFTAAFSSQVTLTLFLLLWFSCYTFLWDVLNVFILTVKPVALICSDGWLVDRAVRGRITPWVQILTSHTHSSHMSCYEQQHRKLTPLNFKVPRLKSTWDFFILIFLRLFGR